MNKLLSEKDMHGYQNTCHDHIIKNNFCGLLLDMGLGKTVTSLTAINTLVYEELEIDKVLVIAPKRVAENVWTTEIKKWSHLKHLKISRVIGTRKQRAAALLVKADIYIVSRDNIAWLCGLYGGSMLPFDMLVVDESSSFKSPKSKRFKALKLVQPSFDRVLLLTGTPAPNGLIDLWSQIYLLDRGERLGKFISHYREKYFKAGKRNGAIVFNYNLKESCEQRIHKQIGDICISMKKEDYLDLPPRINNYIKIVFPPKIRKLYDDFEKEQVLALFDNEDEDEEDLEEVNVTAVNAAVLSNKLLQFAAGAIYDEDKNWHEIHDLKLKEVENIIEDSGGKPVLIFRTYKHDLVRLTDKLSKYKPREIKTSQDIEDWNNGLIQVAIMHPASGGHGLNLQSGGNIIVWYGPTWNLEHYLQANARLDRQGQTESVIVHHLVAEKTIDEDVIKALSSKSSKQNGLMAAIKAKVRKYKSLNKC